MKVINRYIGLIAIFFYILTWFVNGPSKTIRDIGIAIPWISLVLSILIAYIWKVKDNNYFSAWGNVYAIVTVIYVIVVSVISGSIWYQLPHLASCVCFIAYFTLEHQAKNIN